MLFEIVSVIIVVLLFGGMFVGLSVVWEKLMEKVLKQISESTTRRELAVWVTLYVVVSVAIFIVEVFIVATVWEAIF